MAQKITPSDALARMRELDAAMALIADGSQMELERLARAALKAHARLKWFTASMGVVCFYDSRNEPIEDRDLPKLALAVVAYGERHTEFFGSPGIDVRPA